MSIAHIAHLEDDVHEAAIVQMHLTQADFSVECFTSGLLCVRAVERSHFDACILDWLVPDMSGAEVIAALKLKLNHAMPPIIFLTGRDGVQDVVDMLEAGADDYITKPVIPVVLLARLHAVLRRKRIFQPSTLGIWAGLTVNFEQGEFSLEDCRVALGQEEKALALLLLQNIGALLTREHIMRVVFGMNEKIETRVLDVHVSHLRRKLNLRPEAGWRLAAVYGLGYRLERI